MIPPRLLAFDVVLRRPLHLPIAYLVLAFFAVGMPIIMFQNASAWLPVGLLEARCEAAYRASCHPQFEKPSFSCVYGGKTAYVFKTSSAKMTVTEFAAPSLPSDRWKRVRLTCLAGMKGRIKLQPL